MFKKLVTTLPIAAAFFMSCPANGNEYYSDASNTLPKIYFPYVSNQQVALMYLTSGISNLTTLKYEMALEDFQKVHRLLNDSPESSEDVDGIQFIAYFGSAIACDNLNLQSHCEEI